MRKRSYLRYERLAVLFWFAVTGQVYVQHRLQEHASSVARMMLDEGGYLFVCGYVVFVLFLMRVNLLA